MQSRRHTFLEVLPGDSDYFHTSRSRHVLGYEAHEVSMECHIEGVLYWRVCFHYFLLLCYDLALAPRYTPDGRRAAVSAALALTVFDKIRLVSYQCSGFIHLPVVYAEIIRIQKCTCFSFSTGCNCGRIVSVQRA